MLALTVVTVYSRADVTKTSQSTIAVGICCGQLVIGAQTLTVLSNLEVTWVEPAATVMQIVSLFSFDFEVLNLSCLLPESGIISLVPPIRHLPRDLIQRGLWTDASALPGTVQ